MRNCVEPGEEDDGPSDQLMECDVLIERNHVVQRRPPGHGDQISADWEKNEGDVNMQHQGGRTRYRERKTKSLS